MHEQEQSALTCAVCSSSSALFRVHGWRGGAGRRHLETKHAAFHMAVLLYMCSPWDFTVHVFPIGLVHIHGCRLANIDLSLAVSAVCCEGEGGGRGRVHWDWGWMSEVPQGREGGR